MSEQRELEIFSDALSWKTHEMIRVASLARALNTLDLNKHCEYPYFNCDACNSPSRCLKLKQRAEIIALKETHKPHF